MNVHFVSAATAGSASRLGLVSLLLVLLLLKIVSNLRATEPCQNNPDGMRWW